MKEQMRTAAEETEMMGCERAENRRDRHRAAAGRQSGLQPADLLSAANVPSVHADAVELRYCLQQRRTVSTVLDAEVVAVL